MSCFKCFCCFRRTFLSVSSRYFLC
jgi:hypothetical protein